MPRPSLTFVEVSNIGEDVFGARSAYGVLLFTVPLQPDGKTALGGYQEKGRG